MPQHENQNPTAPVIVETATITILAVFLIFCYIEKKKNSQDTKGEPHAKLIII
jgi:hypothetical protein